MKTKNDYEKLFLHAIKPGNVVRVKLQHEKEFNSQRMIIYRLLQTPSLSAIKANISVTKQVEGATDYLVIRYLEPSTEFEFFDNGEFTAIDICKDNDLLTSEEEEFEIWQKNTTV